MNELALFDTSAWIRALRKDYDPAAKTLLEKVLDEDRLVILPIIKVELLAGTRSETDFRRLKSRLDAIPEIPLGRNAWEVIQELAYRLRRHGLEIPLVDTIILAGAKIAGARLYHRDGHFEMARAFFSLPMNDLRQGPRSPRPS
jgi:predicted nucleic acid-binding protein